MNIEALTQYRLLKKEDLTDISSTGYLLRHVKSGARILVIENSDENKVFNIAFRTPPFDSGGVAHILEHSVLCGSEKYPLKDPFVELVKGSLNTFLNAMTYPDKTMYPVASCNATDFRNLMNVYLDAVFYPNIYKKEEIFRQEGWHYELKTPEDDLKYNGVVYNEMKGAFSSAEEMLDREIFNTLFPDTPYGVESGGDPKNIPNLTYEAFLDFHKKYYHPSNAYIYLYGDMNFEETLQWMDQEYLSHFSQISVDSEIPWQEAFSSPIEKEIYYPVGDNESEENNSYLSWNVVTGSTLDIENTMAFEILEYALLSAPGAPVKQALLDAGIGKDVIGSFEDGILQPFFSIAVKNANQEDKECFLSLVRETLEKIVREGMDQKALEAGINYFEFRYREADYASYPKGLIYGLDIFDSWLYDENRPFDYLKQLEIFENLKAKTKTGYFENLIQEKLLHNEHAAIVTAIPKRGLAKQQDEALAAKLADIKSGFSPEEIQNLVEKTAHLKAYQEEEDSPEAIQSIPLLTREDIGKESAPFYNEERKLQDISVLFHEVNTNKIAYVTLFFDANRVAKEQLPYLSLLKSVLAYVDTEKYSYRELFNEINRNSGGIACGLQTFSKIDESDDVNLKFAIRAKCLYQQLPFVFDMIREIITASKLDDGKRLYEIIAQQKSRLQMSIPAAGHQTAVSRVASYYSAAGALSELLSGIDYYKFIEELEEHFEERKENLIAELEKLCRQIFCTENLMIDYTADEEGYACLQKSFPSPESFLHEPAEYGQPFHFTPLASNEGFMTSGQVQYVAVGGDFRKAGFDYCASMQILKMILNYDYLWMNLRVKGGAYGCMSGFKRSGDMYLVSYRDPNIAETLEVYRKTPDYIRNFTADERQMTKYIIGTISGIDTPLTPKAVGTRSLNAWFCGITEEMVQKSRNEILTAQPEDIRNLADLVQAVLDQNILCAVGSEAVVEKDKDCFKEIKHLIG